VIHGFVLLFEMTGRKEDLDTAVELAEKAMHREGPLFDREGGKVEGRMYSDGSFFLHHLVDGYLALSRHAMRERLEGEIVKIAEWGREWMRDEKDGLYFRGSCPWRIDEQRAKRFSEVFGVDRGLERYEEERDKQGRLCKTLLGNAGWVRIFGAEEVIKGGR